jgi:hypothetical protein
MSMNQPEAGLSGEIFKDIQTLVLGNPVPPKDAAEGLQRLADAIGKAVVDYFTAHVEVHVTVTQVGQDTKATFTIT